MEKVSMDVTSLSELVWDVKELKKTHSELWYRGQSNIDYKLVPSLLRSKSGLKNERAIFETYRDFSQRLRPEHKDEWELLIDMQHYFVPTRLLDWSDCLGIALFFAAMNSSSGKDAALFVLDPMALNSKSGKNGIPNMPNDTMKLSYIKAYLNKEPFPAPHPIAIKCSYINERVMAQRGMFTIHGDKNKGLEEEYPEVVTKYRITDQVKEEIRDFLEIANINLSTVYPDFFGVADYIVAKYTV